MVQHRKGNKMEIRYRYQRVKRIDAPKIGELFESPIIFAGQFWPGKNYCNPKQLKIRRALIISKVESNADFSNHILVFLLAPSTLRPFFANGHALFKTPVLQC